MTSSLAKDGHAKKGNFLPPVPLPRRMWAGSRIEYLSPLCVGDDARRESTIMDVQHKSSGDNAMIFVTVQHDIFVDDRLAIREEQDIVYRNPSVASKKAAKTRLETLTPEWRESVRPDAVLLFRYSALTFNAHRIHIDREYAMKEEGYPGLVVHGPLTATLLLNLMVAERTGVDVRTLEIRAQRPLFDTQEFRLAGRRDGDGAILWADDDAGATAMKIWVNRTDSKSG
jgi:3-methylfumaryl-CoA hydratase